MRTISLLLFTLFTACGGASAPAPSPAAPAPQGSEEVSAPADEAAQPLDPEQEALLCEQHCWMSEEGDTDAVAARCAEQCGTAAH